MANFKDRLFYLRNKFELSQEQLSEKLNVSRSAVGNWEQGTRTPRLEDLETIADFFNVDMNYLTGKSDYTTRINPKNQNTYDMVLQLNDDMMERLQIYCEKLLDIQNMEEQE